MIAFQILLYIIIIASQELFPFWFSAGWPVELHLYYDKNVHAAMFVRALHNAALHDMMRQSMMFVSPHRQSTERSWEMIRGDFHCWAAVTMGSEKLRGVWQWCRGSCNCKNPSHWTLCGCASDQPRLWLRIGRTQLCTRASMLCSKTWWQVLRLSLSHHAMPILSLL